MIANRIINYNNFIILLILMITFLSCKDEASDYLRLDDQQDVDLIRSLIRSATNYVETYTGRSLINRQLFESTLQK